jgi:Zn-dependent alcohol dehydrogenase
MTREELVSQLSPLLLQALGVICTGLVAWMAAAIQKRTNAITGQVDMNALHSALTTGATAEIAVNPTATVKQAAEAARDYAASSVPDALKALAPKSDVLAQLSIAKAVKAREAQQASLIAAASLEPSRGGVVGR